jgi:hypothetical protein
MEINFDFLFGLVTKYTAEEMGIVDFFTAYEEQFRYEENTVSLFLVSDI